MISEAYWNILEEWVGEKPFKIDRPKGSIHPDHPNMVYPVDYGYLVGTSAGDGDGIDVWIGSQAERGLQGVILTLDSQKNDAEIKLLVGCTLQEQQMVLEFLNQHHLNPLLISSRRSGLEFLNNRQSIRRFTAQEVRRETLELILEAASRAPSAHNQQPWRYVILQSTEARERLATAMGSDFRKDLEADGFTPETVDYQVEKSHRRIVDAPVAVLICLDMITVDSYPDASRQRAAFLMSVQSVAMAGENLLLAAHALGLGAVWMCAPLFTPQVVQVTFSLPEGWQPQGLVLIGHIEKRPPRRERRELAEMCLYVND